MVTDVVEVVVHEGLCVQAWYTTAFNPAPLLAYLFEICVDYLIPEFFIVLQSPYAFKFICLSPSRSVSSHMSLRRSLF